MSFWKSPTGTPVTGSVEDTFGNGFKLIPAGTHAVAMIKSFTLIDNDQYGERYQIRWKVIDGPHKNREQSQNIYPFDQDANKALRGKNMMARIYKLCGHKPTHDNAPTNDDLAPMQGKCCTIKFEVYTGRDGVERNSISEFHEQYYQAAPDPALQPAYVPETNFDKYAAHSVKQGPAINIPEGFDDDIPF